MKMKIEVWSDIMCPYCYIGKLHYEKALEQFEYKEQIELEWKAFLLNPDLPGKGKGIPVMDYLHKTMGLPKEDINKMNKQIAELAKENKVKSNLENAIAANSLDAHRLVKLAATKGVDTEVMQLLSKAYFEDAKDYSNYTVLTEIGAEAGLSKKEVENLLHNDDYAYEVKQDIQEANNLGFDTVPTFLFNRKHALVGSQPAGAFLKTLQKAFLKWKKQDRNQNENVDVTHGKSCSVDGTCDD